MNCPPEHPHTLNCYTGHRCRCDMCRAANAAHVAARRRRLGPAARIPSPEPIDRSRDSRACVRCGLEREARKSSVLCRDCRDVLTVDERRAWAA